MEKADMIEKMLHRLKEVESEANYLADEAFKSWRKFGEVQNEKNAIYIEQSEILGGIINALDEIDTHISELKFYIKQESGKND